MCFKPRRRSQADATSVRPTLPWYRCCFKPSCPSQAKAMVRASALCHFTHPLTWGPNRPRQARARHTTPTTMRGWRPRHLVRHFKPSLHAHFARGYRSHVLSIFSSQRPCVGKRNTRKCAPVVSSHFPRATRTRPTSISPLLVHIRGSTSSVPSARSQCYTRCGHSQARASFQATRSCNRTL